MASINIDKLATEILSDLELYLANTVKDVEDAVLETAKETVEELKRTSPSMTGDYADSWSQKKDTSIRGKWWCSRVVYSKKPEYRITHLLEHGHAKVSGGRVSGKVAARPHIKKAEQNASIRLHTKLVRKLRNGGS